MDTVILVKESEFRDVWQANSSPVENLNNDRFATTRDERRTASPGSYLSSHDALPLGDEGALGTHAIPPSAITFVPLKRGHDSVITTARALRGPLISLGTGTQEERGREHVMLLLLLLVLHQLTHVDAEADAARKRHVGRCSLTLTTLATPGGISPDDNDDDENDDEDDNDDDAITARLGPGAKPRTRRRSPPCRRGRF